MGGVRPFAVEAHHSVFLQTTVCKNIPEGKWRRLADRSIKLWCRPAAGVTH
jgi:hypothetical protein